MTENDMNTTIKKGDKWPWNQLKDKHIIYGAKIFAPGSVFIVHNVLEQINIF